MDALLRRHYDYVHTVCRRILWRREHADALEQARQEALLRIARGLPRFSFESRLTTWIHQIAVNAALDALGRHQRTPEPAEPDPAEGGRRSSFEDDVEAKLAIDACLEQLPAPYRETVVLCFLAGLEYEDIGRRLGVELGTVKSRIARGRAALKQCLGEAL
jgi:RNA polymerase sigma-70 factor (ECF subfamily)